MANPTEILIPRGETFSLVVRWGNGDQRVSKPITAISLASGWPRLTVVGHGLTDGWGAAVCRVLGMRQINSDGKEYASTVIDPDAIELNGVSPCDDDGKEWPAYTSGGVIEYSAPVDLTGYTGRMKIKNKIGGVVLASTELADAPLNTLTVTLDNAAKTILIEMSATDTAALAFKAGVTDLEMVSPTGRVKRLKITDGNAEDPDPVRVSGEVTT